MEKGLGLDSGGLPLWWGAEEVEEQMGSEKCCSRLFSWLRSRPDTLGVTINRDTPPQRAGRVGQLLPTEVPMFEGLGSATKEDISQQLDQIQN